jgi:hypothetical protein
LVWFTHLDVCKIQNHEFYNSTTKLVTFGIGLAITFGVSLVVSGIIEAKQAHAAIPFDPDMFKRLSSRGFD